MAMLLNDMKTGMSDKVAEQVVDIFLRESEILQVLPFDNTVSPQGGSTLTYTYLQNKLPSMAAFRKLNAEYQGNEATLVKKSADLKIFGGKFSMDHVLKQAESKYNNMAFQMEQKIKAAISLFHYTLINGDATTNEDEFDGLDKMLVGTTTEYNADGSIDVSTMASLKNNADQLYEALQILIKETSADALLMNRSMITKIQTMARILGYTGNDGDTDESNGNYFEKHIVEASAHYFVDSDSVTQSVPDNFAAWSVGGKKYSNCATTGGGKLHGKCTNTNSLNVELCDDVKNGEIYPSANTIENAVDLVKKLMKKYNVPQSNVVRHFDVTGKSCPAYWTSNARWKSEFWNRLVVAKSVTYSLTDFIKDVQATTGAKVDGIAGPETLSKTVTVSMTKNRKHACVMPIQKRLNQLGYDCGTADGIAGVKFRSAVKTYQKQHGCVSDGEITAGKATWKRLLGMP